MVKKCVFCGHKLKETDKVCSSCGSAVRKEVKQQACTQCGYKWVPRKDPKEIRMCPRCKSRKWNL